MSIISKIRKSDDSITYKPINTVNESTKSYYCKLENGEEYFFKINNRVDETKYSDILKTHSFLKRQKFFTPNIIESLREGKKTYFLIEWIKKKREFDYIFSDFENFAKLLLKFYNITSDFKIESSYNPIIHNILYKEKGDYYNKIYNDLIKTYRQKLGTFRIILKDVHVENILISDKFYLLDLDEIKMGEKEYDLACVFSGFFWEKVTQKELKLYSYFLSFFDFDLEKLINYIILIEFNRLNIPMIEYSAKKKNLVLKKVSWLYRNKEQLQKHIREHIENYKDLNS